MATSNRLTIYLPLEPRPAARPRFVCRGKFAQAYTDGAYRAWQDAAKDLLAGFRPFNSDSPHTGDVAIRMTVAVPKPKKTVKRRPAGDNDNFEKGIYDAITQTKGFWEDDDQIVENTTRKVWATAELPAGYYIEVTFL